MTKGLYMFLHRHAPPYLVCVTYYLDEVGPMLANCWPLAIGP